MTWCVTLSSPTPDTVAYCILILAFSVFNFHLFQVLVFVFHFSFYLFVLLFAQGPVPRAQPRAAGVQDKVRFAFSRVTSLGSLVDAFSFMCVLSPFSSHVLRVLLFRTDLLSV